MIHRLTTRRLTLASMLRGLVAQTADPAVVAAREAAVAAVGEHDAATIRQLSALTRLARDPAAGEIGQRLATASLERGIDTRRAAELCEHLQPRRHALA